MCACYPRGVILRRALFGLAFLLVALPAGAVRPKAPPPPPPQDPPKVDVTLTATEPALGWSVRLTNAGLVPLRVVADARLLSFDIVPAGGGTAVRCALPADMVPSSDAERGLVLVPGRSYTERFDPRLYCFGAREAAALVPGAQVTPHYGFGGRGTGAPFVALPLAPDGTDRSTLPASVRMLHGSDVTLPATAPAATPAAPPPAAPLEANPVRLRVTLAERIDFDRIFERMLTVSVHNDGDRPVRTLLRPSTIGFTVTTPGGVTVRCGDSTAVHPIAELLGTIGPRGRADVTLQPGAICPSGTFDEAGLYSVTPRLDTSQLGEGAPGVRLFRGEVKGTPSLLRLRTGTALRPGPKVDPAP